MTDLTPSRMNAGAQAQAAIPPPVPNTTSTREHLKQKRARSQLNCMPCRVRKMKCNRERPTCDQCIKRSREDSCTYVPPPVKNKAPQGVKGRIRQLESLVVDLMNQSQGQVAPRAQAQAQPTNAEGADGQRSTASIGLFSQLTPPSDSDMLPESANDVGQSRRTTGTNNTSRSQEDHDGSLTLGKMNISKDGISYVGESHWGAILSSISELKRELGDDDPNDADGVSQNDASGTRATSQINGWTGGASPHSRPMDSTQPYATTGLGFMLGDAAPVTQEQLIKSMPEKRMADRLLSLWFNSLDPLKPIIHAPTFQEEYKRFWKSPRDTPVMWLGLLYAIMSIAASFGLRDIDPKSQQAMNVLQEANRYHSLSASAALLSDFTKPKEYTIECLILHAAGLRSSNGFVNIWLTTGLIVRMALRMGYHRDAKHYPNISVFQGEMRRRTWGLISMVDVLISFQLGLPSMVRTIQYDAEPPSNLLDRDFGPSSKSLPPSRGADELTPSSYMRVKLKLTRIFADAAEMSHATTPPEYEIVMENDRKLEEARVAIPPLLAMPDSPLVTDPAEQLMCRFNLDLLYLKTKLVLHRRYMLTPISQLSDEEKARGIGNSRRTCIDCALRVLQHHNTIYTASQPGGQLESVKWYMGSISTHDFLLAAMVICLELSQQINQSAMDNLSSGRQCPQQKALMDALERSQKIWEATSQDSSKRLGSGHYTTSEHMFTETEKAAQAMAVMLQKVRSTKGRPPGPQSRVREDGHPSVASERADGMGQGGTNGSKPFLGIVSMGDWSIHSPGFTPAASFTNPPFIKADASIHPPTIPSDQYDLRGPNTGTDIYSNTMNSINTSVPDIDPDSIPQPPFQQQPDQPDFSMINDMLDFDTTDLDWEIWDNQITQAPRPDQSWQDTEFARSNYAPTDFNPFGPVDEPLPGNAIVGGTGPLPSTDEGGFQGNAFGRADGGLRIEDFMTDVDFDLGVHDYNRNGIYPASKTDWEKWRSRKAREISRGL